MKPRRFLWIAGTATLLGFGGAGLAIIYYIQHRSISSLLPLGIVDALIQISAGVAYALFFGIILIQLLRTRRMDATKHFFASLMRRHRVGKIAIVLLSLCAGLGEELFFRGALQYWLGIWLTAVVFIALHGYLSPGNRAMMLYGISLCIISAGFGYLAQLLGLTAAAAAHCVIDIMLFAYLGNFMRTMSSPTTIDGKISAE